MSEPLRFTTELAVSPAQVYFALTNSTGIASWLGNDVRSDPRPGGRFYVWWQEGYYTAGEYVELVENERLLVRWHGKDEPASSQVTFELRPVRSGTELTVTHGDLGTGADWDEARTALQKGWENGLADLKSVLEDGLPVALKKQPLLGISGGNGISPEVAAQLNVPVSEGFQIAGIIPGLGAEAAGLAANDVVVQFAGQPIKDWPTLQALVSQQVGGDIVPVTVYRGPEKIELDLTLSARPVLPVVSTGDAIADQVEGNYAQMLAELRALFVDAGAAANQRPAEDEWSADEVLAHLIQVEQWAHMWLNMAINGLPGTGYGGNWNPWIEAMTGLRSGTDELLAEYEKQCQVSVAMLRALPVEFLQRRFTYNNIGHMFALGLPNHTRNHFGQILAAIQTAQAAAVPAD
ncbi:MAG: SRPBCC domain-containing protein [Anaerolineales bacterium]|nr:SRPBCC domain-containing protein [Anaerolineales bacterium]